MAETQTLPSAQPIEGRIFCTECEELHPFDDGQVSVEYSDMCEIIRETYGVVVDALPEDWERTYHADFHTTGRDGDRKQQYLLVPKRVDPLPLVHRPAYYLEATP